jgi:nucleoside-diphosphate-sugar epimerase
VSSVVDPRPKLGFAQADLLRDDGWEEAMRGIDYVLHVASPLGDESVKNAEALIAPARDGTLRVLKAASEAGVKRVVMTSAANAASPVDYRTEGITDETLWTVDSSSLPAYRRSKTIAERAAWDFVERSSGSTELTTILPGAVLGPVLTAENIGTASIVQRMLCGKMPGVPRIGLEVVDVRDLVDLHIRAMISPNAVGERFLGTGPFTWMSEIARVLKRELGELAAKVPTRELPNFMVRIASLFDPSLRSITISLGRRNRHSIEKAERLLGWTPRPAEATVVECARSLIAHGVAP